MYDVHGLLIVILPHAIFRCLTVLKFAIVNFVVNKNGPTLDIPLEDFAILGKSCYLSLSC